MDGIDLSSWVGKPPERPDTPEEPTTGTPKQPVEVEDAPDDALSAPDEQPHLSPSDESDIGDIMHDDGNTSKTNGVRQWPAEESLSDEDDEEENFDDQTPLIGSFQKHFYIDVPSISETEKELYEYLPGHFAVDKVLSQGKDKRYMVQLQSGEQDIVSALADDLSPHL